ncbi:unnamed protein product [Linum tenue]|uniref:Uncharacterized protein n=1 Tax=Linum tenue TaxID=586396 RepID=A0AAV0J184_9ROSI|nr:unnamed protein product [Linum tenue]
MQTGLQAVELSNLRSLFPPPVRLSPPGPVRRRIRIARSDRLTSPSIDLELPPFPSPNPIRVLRPRLHQ